MKKKKLVGMDKESNIQGLFGKGSSFQAQGSHQDAIACFDEVIRIEPGHAIAYHRRGIAHGAMGQYELAINDYSEAIRLNPEFAAAYNNIRDFDEAIRINPTHAAAYNGRGMTYLILGQYKLAIGDFEEATRLDPNDEGACRNLAVALEHIDTGRALKAWARYLQIVKNPPPIRVGSVTFS